MEDLKIGIVGLGWVAGAHIQALKNVPGCRVTGVSSRRKLDPGALRSQYGIPLAVYPDYVSMLADPAIDAIDICTPHPFHAEQAIEAARAGKHLILEKPMALTYRDASAIRDACRKARVNVCVCFECRFSAHFQTTKSVIDQGLLGKLHYGEVDYYHGIGPWYRQFSWNAKKSFGGSSLLTAGCHALDALLYTMDAPVEEVTTYQTRSSCKAFAPYEYPTTTVTILKFRGGAVGKVASVVDCLQPYYFHTHLVGSEGSLLDNRFYSQKIKGLRKEWSVLQTSLVDSGDVKDHPYEPQFKAFVQSTKSGRPMPLTGLAEAFETHRVIFAADKSAAEGRPVKLSEFR